MPAAQYEGGGKVSDGERGRAKALTVYFERGSQDYIRTGNGETATWCEAKTTMGRGAPYEGALNAQKLTPAELAEVLK
jgi:hypothetical protein